MAEKAAGYVVRNLNGRFLSRSLNWVRHRRGKPERAWVHPLEVLVQGGAWSGLARKAAPAIYDPTADATVVTGEFRAIRVVVAEATREAITA